MTDRPDWRPSWPEVPEGHEVVAIIDPDWEVDPGKPCRYARQGIHQCGEPSAASLLRGIYRKSRWAYCVVPETPVLTADLRWVPAGDLTVGQEIIGVDEEPTGNPDNETPMMRSNRNRFYRRAQVMGTPRRVAECIELTLADGRQVVSATEHRWLAWHPYARGAAYYRELAKSGVVRKGYDWTFAAEITPGMEIASPLRVWPEETSFEAGWVSGILDGEGWLSRCGGNRTEVGVAQNAGPVLDAVRKYLDNRSIPYSIKPRKEDNCVRLKIGTRWAAMELIGRLRPIRLAHRSSQLWEDRRVISSGDFNRTAVAEARAVGRREVVSLATSTSTYIANGLISHNCPAHMYGRWVEEGFVMHWILVKVGSIDA